MSRAKLALGIVLGMAGAVVSCNAILGMEKLDPMPVTGAGGDTSAGGSGGEAGQGGALFSSCWPAGSWPAGRARVQDFRICLTMNEFK